MQHKLFEKGNISVRLLMPFFSYNHFWSKKKYPRVFLRVIFFSFLLIHFPLFFPFVGGNIFAFCALIFLGFWVRAPPPPQMAAAGIAKQNCMGAFGGSRRVEGGGMYAGQPQGRASVDGSHPSGTHQGGAWAWPRRCPARGR